MRSMRWLMNFVMLMVTVVTATTVTTLCVAVSASAAEVAPGGSAAFDLTSKRFLADYWQAMPDNAINAGKFDGASRLALPDSAERARTLKFARQWTQRLKGIDEVTLVPLQRADLAMMRNELASIEWNLTQLRSYEWNPSDSNMSGALDALLNTEFAPLEQRLRIILQRLDQGPAYYRAARASIVRPTREHTALAISQLPGALAMLDDIDKAVQRAQLTSIEKEHFVRALQKNRAAVNTFMTQLQAILPQLNDSNARSFRMGKTLYDAKFGYDIQSSYSAEETYQRALQAKGLLLEKMAQLTDTLWPNYLAGVAKPEGRAPQIKMLIDKLSENHILRTELFAEVRKQIPQLEEWVSTHDLITLDPSRPLIVRETPAYQRGIAGASVDAPGPYQAMRPTYYNVTPIDAETPEQAESFLANTTIGSCRS